MNSDFVFKNAKTKDMTQGALSRSVISCVLYAPTLPVKFHAHSFFFFLVNAKSSKLAFLSSLTVLKRNEFEVEIFIQVCRSQCLTDLTARKGLDLCLQAVNVLYLFFKMAH